MNGWDWRKSEGGWTLPGDRRGDDGRLVRVFHAYDERDNAGCDERMGLSRSVEEANEGSEFCPECMNVVVYGRPIAVDDE